MQLTKLSETSTTITLGWTPVPGCLGYVFYADGTRVSNTWDPLKSSIRFSKGPTSFKVVAVGNEDEGVYPSAVAGPTPPAPPQGQLQVLDGGGTTFSFPQAFPRGAGVMEVKGLKVQRVTGMGVGSMEFYPPPPTPTALTTITDCIANDVKANPPGSAGGTSEANFWIGNKTKAARLQAARSGWMGMFTGSKCWDSVIEDFELQDFAVGVYIEHVTRDTVFRRFKIHNIHDQQVAGGSEPGNILRARSISIEWWYGGKGSYNLTFEDGDIYCPASVGSNDEVRAGVYVGPGTYGLTFRRCRFTGPGPGMWLPLQRQGHPDAVVEDCWFEQDGPDILHHNHAIG